MSFYNLIAFIITLAIGFAYINQRWLKMPTTIGIMCASLILALIMIIAGKLGNGHLIAPLSQALARINFHDVLINGMLGYLLFAGAMTVDVRHLREQGWEVAILAMLGTLASTFLIGIAVYYLIALFGLHLPIIYCLLFGALISPTDPIAVLAMFKDVKAPRHMVTVLEGESLFNDGIGIVIFLTIYQVAFHLGAPTWSTVTLLFLQQALGGIIFGLIAGGIGFYLIRSINAANLAILLTIGLVAGGYTLAQMLGVSGALAMVVAGIMVGNACRGGLVTSSVQLQLETFWEVLDELLNAVLFLLVGLELFIMPWSVPILLVGLATIPLVLCVRFITVATPIRLLALKKSYYPYFISILTWGGLRGGLAIALALALPRSAERDVIMSMTYLVVLFAILVQGLTMKPLIAKSLAKLKSH
jgi:CPA1 family monovalent cation:H+ antiporter